MKYVIVLLLVILFALSISNISADDTSIPEPPTELEADDVSPTKIDLSWNPPKDDGNSPIIGYKIEYKIIPNDYQLLIADTGNSETVYSHSNLKTGKTYVYRIYAINAIGTSISSGESAATPKPSSVPPEQIPPNPPTQIISNDVSPTQIDVTWEKPSENNGPKVFGYVLERKTTDEYIVLINNTSSTKHSDTDLITGVTYFYRVFALNSVGISNSSAIVSSTTTEDSAPPVEQIVPNEPRGVVASVVSPTEIVLNWFAPKPNDGPSVVGYRIEVMSGSEFKTLHDTVGVETTYTHSDLDVGTTYTYRIFAINSIGISAASNESHATPEHTLVPTALVATSVSPTQIDLTWNPPSQTYGQDIVGYEIQKRIAEGYYETISTTDEDVTSYSIGNLETDKEYAFVVFAKFTLGSSDISEEVIATPTEDSAPVPTETVPSSPTNLIAIANSPTKITLSWDVPSNDGGATILGYKIEMKVESGSFITLVNNSDDTNTTYVNDFRTPNTKYTYRVYAINSVGVGHVSNETSAVTNESAVPVTSGTTSSPPSRLVAEVTDINQITLSWDAPFVTGGSEISAYNIEAKKNSGSFEVLQDDKTSTIFVHSDLESDATYTYRIYAINAKGSSSPSNIVTITLESEVDDDPTKRIPGFPDPEVDPQSYVDRYNNEISYREWFDKNFPDYTIYEIVGVEPPTESEVVEDISKIHKSDIGVCGVGTELVNGICTKIPKISPESDGGCLIATAAFGSELAPQVQFLREVRDNTVMSTTSGTAFMTGFNQLYYSFSPTIADMERENPAFKEAIKLFITPMVYSLSIMTLAEDGSESDVLIAGISVIALNLAMYIAAPAIVVYKIKKLV